MELPQAEPVEQGTTTLTPQIVTIVTTEHYNLQSAQAQEIADINGRTTLFIGAISGALIALAFIGQLSHVGTAFFVFSLVLFPLPRVHGHRHVRTDDSKHLRLDRVGARHCAPTPSLSRARPATAILFHPFLP